MTEERIYLDCNATTRIDSDVLDCYTLLLKDTWGNPSSTHKEGRIAHNLLLDAKDRIKKALNAPSNYDVFFFSSATEALNTALKGIVSSSIKRKKLATTAKSLLSTEIEHAAVYETVKFLGKSLQNCNIDFIPSNTYGAVQIQDVEVAVESQIQKNSSLVCASFLAVNNETGVITRDLPKIASYFSQYAIPLVVDGVALLGKAPVQFYEGITAMIFSGHKIHAPKGIGFAFIDRKAHFDPLIVGGPQQSGKRAGTENPALAQALALAVEKITRSLSSDITQMEMLHNLFEKSLRTELSSAVCLINGDGERVSSTSNIAFSGIDGEDLLFKLDLKGVSASHGSACASGALEPSRILLNMGYSYERASSSLRFSISRFTTKEEIEKALQIIINCVKASRRAF